MPSFDFQDRKAQHAPTPLDKKVFCDFLLGSTDHLIIGHRFQTATHPPVVLRHEGGGGSAAKTSLDTMWKPLTIS